MQRAANILNKLNAPSRYRSLIKLCDNSSEENFAKFFNEYVSGITLRHFEMEMNQLNGHQENPIHRLIRRDMGAAITTVMEFSKEKGLKFDWAQKGKQIYFSLTLMDSCLANGVSISAETLQAVVDIGVDVNNEDGNRSHPLVVFADKQAHMNVLFYAGASIKLCQDKHDWMPQNLSESIAEAHKQWIASDLRRQSELTDVRSRGPRL